ncbi:hypothetical protein J3Q64DRAFT_1103362 [Phycomyces blakesleeanus]|uniref:Homeodomain-like DNA binding domain-containing transcription factor n=1 Tax=Phycomyces blakesleeanus TaxID=4837 RepID=A0ABR3AZB3_PHYBL
MASSEQQPVPQVNPVEEPLRVDEEGGEEKDQLSRRSSATDQDQYSHFANQLPLVVPNVRTKPRRSTNALHLLVQEAARNFILSDLVHRSAESLAGLAKDRRKVWTELRQYSDAKVLGEAKEKIMHELRETDKEALTDVSPESEIIRMRFDEHEAVSRSFEDALTELRYEHNNEGEEEGRKDLEELFKALEPLIVSRPRPVERTQPRFEKRGRGGGGYHVGTRNPPYPVHQFRPRDVPGYSRGGPRDYRDRRDREEYYRRRYEEDDRREFERRPPLPPLPPHGYEDYRGRRDPYPPRPPFDDHRRIPRPDPKDSRFPNPRDSRPFGGPGGVGPGVGIGGPMKPGPVVYEPTPKPPIPVAVDPSTYGYPPTADPYAAAAPAPIYDPNAQYYPPDPSMAVYGPAYPAPYPPPPPQAQQAAPQPWYPAPITLSFSSRDPGRHMALPLPTDFMAGPSEAPR